MSIGDKIKELRTEKGFSHEELAEIIRRSAIKLGVEMENDACLEVAKRSRGTPRIVNRLLKRVRDFSLVLGHEQITLDDAKLALNRLDIDDLGLDTTDKRLLSAMIERFKGGPVGLETLAATVNEDANTLEDVYEPYLLQLGFIARTTRGRVCLKKAYEHLGYKVPKDFAEQPTLFD